MRGRMLLAALALLALACAPDAARAPAVVVIGIDGMDPRLLDRFMDEGLMPNFKALAERGGYSPLETSIPPQSPVAWSNFITGMDPGGHGIFDFIHRDPETYQPVFSAALVAAPEKTFTIGDWVIPLSSGKVELERKGEAFWQILDRHHVPSEVLRIPSNFPPTPTKARTLSGMGTPDLLGSYGTFSFYTDDLAFEPGEVSGGTIYRVVVTGNRVESALVGPENTMRKGRPKLTRRFDVELDPEHEAARLDIGGHAVVLVPGEWSEWVPVRFDVMGPLKQIHGMCRFHLSSMRPFRLYATPINIDPEHPDLPISTPKSFARRTADRIGRYYTQGMPEDTKALEAGVLSDSEFVAQTDVVLSERWRLLDAALADYRGGFLFFYVSTIDQSSHMLWRNDDPTHPEHTAGMDFPHRFAHLYAEMDSLLGVVVSRIPEEATLIVMSDHGFAPFYKQFHLNTWLYQEGYLSLEQPDLIGQYPLLGNVFWRRTRAYGLGLNGLYVNEVGRESKGVVRAGAERDALLDEISSKLLALRDPETGVPIVTAVDRPRDVYHGPEAAHAPDLIVGYNRGYRCSDKSALGTLTKTILSPNESKWSGDHCMDHTLVPGVLLSNRPLTAIDPSLLDLPVTILGLYGIDKPEAMRGRAVLGPEDSSN